MARVSAVSDALLLTLLWNSTVPELEVLPKLAEAEAVATTAVQLAEALVSVDAVLVSSILMLAAARSVEEST